MLLTVVMLISVLYIAPYTASATDEEATTFTSGDYTYSLLEDGTAEITKYTGSENDLTIPTALDGNKVTQIGGYSFEKCTSIESLTIPEGITAIGSNAFRYCKNIRTVSFPDGLITISNGGFSFCESLENVVIPDSVTTLGNYAFQSCKAMTSIELPSNIEVLSDFLLTGCENLTSIDIPTSVKEIGQNTFAHCYGLTSVTVPDGVTLINNGAFSYCKNLTSVSLPDTLETVNAFAFSSSTKLMEVTVPNSVSEIGRCAFGYWFDKSIWNDIPLQGFVLKGYSGSVAETYAQESGVTFESISDPNAIKPTGITLSDKEVTVKENKTVTVTANVLPANATDKKVIWSSNDESVATVAAGVIKGLKEGTAIITASTANGCTASVTVTVEKRFVSSTKIFFKNTGNWSSVCAYAWKETTPVVNNKTWPGETMTCIDEENKIYCVELDAGIDYEKIIFNDGGSTNKTGDLLVEGYEMLYDFGTSKWEDYTQTEQGTVNVKYVDEKGTVLISTSIRGDVGAKYTTSAKTIDGYTLKTTPANATGTYTSGTITVTYVYTKNNVDTPLAGTLKANGSTGSVTVAVGSTVELSGGATGGSGNYTYKFLVWNTDTNTWFKLQDYSSNNTVTWKAGSEGNRKFYVDIKDSEGTVVRANVVTVTTTKAVEQPLAITATANSSAVRVGDNVTITAQATGGKGDYTYNYLVCNTDTNAWFRLNTTFTASNAYTWKASSTGNRKFYVEVKDSAGTVVRSAAVGVSVANTTSALSVTGNASAASVNVGDTVKITGTAAGGSGSYTYSFLVWNTETNEWFRFNKVFTTSNTLSWKASSAGTRKFYVEAKDSTGKVVRSTAQTVVTK